MKEDVFPRTHNTWIGRKLLEGVAGRNELNRHVMEVYADPLRVYFLGTPDRRHAEAEEVVEGFFADRLARGDFFDDWKMSGLRLRRWLMNGLGFYLKELRRARKRGNRSQALDEERDAPLEDSSKDVEREMDRAFAIAIVRQALGESRRACAAKGLERHWEVFYRHYYQGQGYGEFAPEFGVEAAKASDMARTAAGRFRDAMRDLLASDGALESEIDQEIEMLLEICG